MTLVSQLQTHLLHFLSVEQFNDKSLAKNKDKKLRCWAACVWSYYAIEPLGALIGNLLPEFSEQLRIRIWYTNINLCVVTSCVTMCTTV